MASLRAFLVVLSLLFAIFSVSVVVGEAQSLSPAAAPSPSSDGTAIDQGIAYFLMLVALILTYLIHPLDASSFF
ncbi:arabinogalactan protein 20-like [Neltuma alba]|uniref:arabinogalactan protein 20-like n=1 Tax=Neltuma alba TaxID=207710 RepID=UPI0010A3E9A4|nr:arabinogalactan protein 20-like [Prosopis alba]